MKERRLWGAKKPSKKLDISESLFEQHWFPARKEHGNIQTEEKYERQQTSRHFCPETSSG
jgi:hypothetical protein